MCPGQLSPDGNLGDSRGSALSPSIPGTTCLADAGGDVRALVVERAKRVGDALRTEMSRSSALFGCLSARAPDLAVMSPV